MLTGTVAVDGHSEAEIELGPRDRADRLVGHVLEMAGDGSTGPILVRRACIALFIRPL